MYCSTYYFVCLLSAPLCQRKFLVGVNVLGNKNNSYSDSDQCFYCEHSCFSLFPTPQTNSLRTIILDLGLHNRHILFLNKTLIH